VTYCALGGHLSGKRGKWAKDVRLHFFNLLAAIIYLIFVLADVGSARADGFLIDDAAAATGDNAVPDDNVLDISSPLLPGTESPDLASFEERADEERRKYDALIVQAREGDHAPALEFLRGLGTAASESQIFDHILISSWAGLPDEVVSIYENLPAGLSQNLPVDVAIAVARSFRDLKNWQSSLDVWHAFIAQNPEEAFRLAPGLIMTLADAGQIEEAVRSAQEWLARYPNDDVRAATAYAHTVQERMLAELAQRQAELARQREQEKYDALIVRAREGDSVPALEFLRGLGERATPSQRFDHILVASWADFPEEVSRIYKALPDNLKQTAPADVQQAVARALRNLKRFSEALAVSREGMKQHPQQASGFVPVLAMTLADRGLGQEAERIGLDFLARSTNNADLHMALAYLYMRQERPFDVLYHTDQAMNIAPQANWIEDEYIRALSRAGLAEQALERARKTGRFRGGELRGMEANVAALKTRLAAMPTRSEGERFVIADRALALYEQMMADWQRQGEAAKADLIRIRIDRLAALHARMRMADLVREYEILKAEGVQIPTWALSNVASAYLYMRQPEKARDIYYAVLADIEANTPPEEREHLGPANARLANDIALLYALVEAEQFDELEEVLARIKAYKPAFLYFKGNPMPSPNEHSIGAQLAVVATDMAKDDMPQAQVTMEMMVNQAPNNASLRAELAGIYRARSQPRLAEEHLKLAETIEPRSLDIEIQQGLTALELQEWRQVEELSRDAIGRFPENRTAQRLARLWQVHNKAEFRVNSHHGLASRTNAGDVVAGRGDFGLESVLYSRPMQYNWRAFMGGSHTRGEFSEGKGHYSTLRSGLEWRSRDLWLEAEMSANRYGHGTKLGGRLSGTYDLSDHWQIGGSLDYLSRSTPVRALRSGIRSDSAQLSLRWRGNERREWSGVISTTRFGDDNNRLSLDVNGTERLYTTPNLRIDLDQGLSYQRNSKDDDRPYFNPKRDFVALTGLRATHKLYRRYENVWEHFASLSLGVHRQKDYGTDEIWGIAYGHRYRHNDIFAIGATLDFLSRSYDGKREGELRLLIDLTSRF